MLISNVGMITLRPGTSGDAALNYFFGILFIIYFLVGVLLSPLTTMFSFRQSASPSSFLLTLISVLDHIKLIYFPLVLVPKLLQPDHQMELYVTLNRVPVSGLEIEMYVSWIACLNTVMVCVTGIEMFLVVMMCVVRYTSVKFSSLPPSLLYIIISLVLIFVLIMSLLPLLIFDLDSQSLIKLRVSQMVMTGDQHYIDKIYKPTFKCKVIVMFLFLFLAVLSGALMMVRLIKKRECPDRQFQISTSLMNLCNMVVLAVSSSYIVVASNRANDNPQRFSMAYDFLIFSATYGIPLTQSVFNTCCLAWMKSFRKEMFQKVKVSPQDGEIDRSSAV